MSFSIKVATWCRASPPDVLLLTVNAFRLERDDAMPIRAMLAPAKIPRGQRDAIDQPEPHQGDRDVHAAVCGVVRPAALRVQQ